VEYEIRRFQIAAFFGDLFDGIPTITKYAFVAVNISNLALARSGIHEPRVIAYQAVVISDFDLKQVGRLDGAVLDRNLVLFAGPIIDHCQSL
jgi:hypothetical protein